MYSLWRSHSYPETITLKELLIQSARSSLCSFWSLRFYPAFKEFFIQSTHSSSCSLWSSRSYPETIPLKELLIQSTHSSSCFLWSSHSYLETILLKEFLIQSVHLSSFVMIFFFGFVFEFLVGVTSFTPPKFETYSEVFELLYFPKDNFHCL